MKGKKEDRRTLYTKSVLKQSLLELMQAKPVSKISVSDICKKADINRNTFYRYYYGPENLLYTIEEEFFDVVKISLDDINDINLMSRELCLLIKENKELSLIIFSDQGDASFLKKIIQYEREKFLNEWIQHIKPEKVKLIKKMYRFSEGGMIAIITDWVRSGFADDLEEIVSFIMLSNDLLKNIQQEI